MFLAYRFFYSICLLILMGRHAWYGEDFASGSTNPVGRKESNDWGLYDVHGNVCEWVQDWYEEGYYAISPAEDPKGRDPDLVA
jgi:formylglycine-generating enzyme required for sulfatase activity